MQITKTVLVVGALAVTTAFALAQAPRTHELTLLPQNAMLAKSMFQP